MQGSPHFGHDSVFFLFGGSLPFPDPEPPDDAADDPPDDDVGVVDPLLPLPFVGGGGGGVSFVDLSQTDDICIGRNANVVPGCVTRQYKPEIYKEKKNIKILIAKFINFIERL